MIDVSRMDYGELTRLQDALEDIISARRLEAEFDLEGMETSALEMLNEAACDALEAYEKAEADYMRLEYERSVI